MPTTNRLTDAQCKHATPNGSAQKLSDGNGMFLLVTPAGGKRWRMSYRIDGKQQTATFGPYPHVSLADARKKRDELLAKLHGGADPRAKAKVVPTLRECWTEYWEGREDVSEGYVNNGRRGLEMHLGKIGDMPVDKVTSEVLLHELLKLNKAGKYTYVRRVRMWSGLVFKWAKGRHYIEVNPCVEISPKDSFGNRSITHFAALELNEVPAFMERLSYEQEHLLSVLALKLMALTWVRTKEIRSMRWSQIEGDEWVIPSGTMKKRRHHVVPLPKHAKVLLAMVRSMRPEGEGEYVFAAEHTPLRPISENAILALIGRMGYKGKMTGHGFRSVASTWAHKNGFPGEAIELQLSHAPKDKVASAYNRYEYIEVRRQMLKKWADWLLQAVPPRLAKAA